MPDNTPLVKTVIVTSRVGKYNVGSMLTGDEAAQFVESKPHPGFFHYAMMPDYAAAAATAADATPAVTDEQPALALSHEASS